MVPGTLLIFPGLFGATFEGARSEPTTGPNVTITPLRSVNTLCPGCSKDTPTISESEQSTHTESANHPESLMLSLHWTPLSLRSSMVGLIGIVQANANSAFYVAPLGDMRKCVLLLLTKAKSHCCFDMFVYVGNLKCFLTLSCQLMPVFIFNITFNFCFYSLDTRAVNCIEINTNIERISKALIQTQQK